MRTGSRSSSETSATPQGGTIWRVPFILGILGAAQGCGEVTITAADAASVTVSPREDVLFPGETRQLTAAVQDEAGNVLPDRSVTWSSEDESVAVVSTTGVVESRASGVTRIRAEVGGIEGSATITVLPQDEPDDEPDEEPEDETGSGSCDMTDRVISEDLDIGDGESCVFRNVRVRGNLRLGPGSGLVATDVEVSGNIQARSASSLTLVRSEVEGNLRFDDGGNLEVRDSSVNGNLTYRSNRGRLTLERNAIDGNVRVEDNSGGPFRISDNTIGGNLRCEGNDPAPTGSGNVAAGDADDQCEEF